MAQKDRVQKETGGDPAQREEARHLAEEALEEMSQGNKDEAKFVLDEARALDKGAVDQVLKEQKKTDL